MINYSEHFTPRFDLLVSELCEEIDYWKERAKQAEQRADKIQAKYSDALVRDIAHGERMTGLFLAAVLNGNLHPVENSPIFID